MRAMRLLGEGQAIVTDRPEPRPGPGQVLLKMKAAAICGSDLHRYKLKLSDDDPTVRFVPGHEPCGDIVEIGPGVDRLVRRRACRCLPSRYLHAVPLLHRWRAKPVRQ